MEVKFTDLFPFSMKVFQVALSQRRVKPSSHNGSRNANIMFIADDGMIDFGNKYGELSIIIICYIYKALYKIYVVVLNATWYR